MPVVPVNSVPIIGLLPAHYWHSTGAVFCGSTGWVLAVYNIQIRDINRHRSLIDISHPTGLVLSQCWSLLLIKYWQVSYTNLRHSTGLMLAVNKIQILVIKRHRNLIDSWGSTGLLLVQYWLTTGAVFCGSTGWVLAVYNI